MSVTCGRTPVRYAEEPGRRRRRRFVVRIGKHTVGIPALGTPAARGRQGIIFIIIGAHDGRQALLIDARRRQTVLRRSRRSGHDRRKRQRQQKSS
jgi:hypothetical protein